MQDLKEVTAANHYENFRSEKLRVIASQSNFDASAGKYVLSFTPSHFDTVYCSMGDALFTGLYVLVAQY